ncbi:10303_t:CDS:1, partial [Acaulospora morrowiae]
QWWFPDDLDIVRQIRKSDDKLAKASLEKNQKNQKNQNTVVMPTIQVEMVHTDSTN